MRLANLNIVRKLKPRLGFGEEEPQPEAEQAFRPDAPPAAPPTRSAIESNQLEAESQVSLMYLLSELESALEDAPVETPDEKAGEGPREIAELASPPQAELFESLMGEAVVEVPPPTPEPAAATAKPIPAQEKAPPPKTRNLLEGRKVGAIGFGRQDIAGLATGMIDQRARIEFLARGGDEPLSEFDLLLVNTASVETLKRDAKTFRSILESGIPTVVIGTRTSLSVLHDSGDARTWDFIAKPLHMDELVWRASNLLSRFEESGIARPLPARVVVADHDPFTRMLVESTLTQSGIECTIAEEGDTAWTAIEKSHPGAVILDLTLPNRDGFQLLADIRRAPGRKPKIIVLSARQAEADILRAFALGADDYVTKPFSPLELSARLMRLLGGRPTHA